MILSSFSYKTDGWELVKMDALSRTNLLVGKNASGKTRTIKALQNVTSFLQMKTIMFPDIDFKAKLTFVDFEKVDWEMTYAFETADKKVVNEQLIVCGKTLVKRDTVKTLLNADSINPPAEKLVVQVRRDREAYPEIEALMGWAENVTAISCSNINPFTIFNGPAGHINPMPFSDLVVSLSPDEKKSVIEEAKQLGYNIVGLTPLKFNNDIKLVEVKERYVKKSVLDFQLSSGMMRVLYLLCFLKSMKRAKTYSMLLIDDMGEGLDYSRATKLGKMIFETCEKEGVQLMASSNDSFLMDVVDISKWQILRRENTKLSVLNEKNSPKMFSHFRMTGLSNFDFFSSDFINNYLAEADK